ncbi:MAG: SAM-dependent chlorinase/fluorinase [Pseudomonadota bacterium]|nr:SAM-dependent chlorinase/fluorinase [Pseudomonadota bacterium]
MTMIALYTDFGVGDPYVGQLHAVLREHAPEVPVIDLLHQVPPFGIQPGAYLLPALAGVFSAGTVFLGVVDPGVGGSRESVVLEIDGKWYVGPDNGLFAVTLAQGSQNQAWRIRWRPEYLSESFHGRDLFAPIAAAIARGDFSGLTAAGQPSDLESGLLAKTWPADLPQVIYIDHYGNAVTGWREAGADTGGKLQIGKHLISHARTFSAVVEDQPFWYINSMGLVEIAVNRGSAAELLELRIGAHAGFAG